MSPVAPDLKVPATGHVLDYILGEMDAGRLGPGERINASRIARSLGLSVTPVREALGQLAGRGVIELLPDRGAVIRNLTVDDSQKLFLVISAIASVGMMAAARAAAAGANCDQLTELHDKISSSFQMHKPVDFLLRLNAWHFEANRIANNEFVTHAFERVGLTFYDRFLVRFIDISKNIEGYRFNYRRMHDAVIAGDPASAAAAMDYHANWSIALIAQSDKLAPKSRVRRKQAGTQ